MRTGAFATLTLLGWSKDVPGVGGGLEPSETTPVAESPSHNPPPHNRYLFQVPGSTDEALKTLRGHGIQLDAEFPATAVGATTLLRGWASGDAVSSLEGVGVLSYPADIPIGPAAETRSRIA